ncbi:Signal transduction histidine kinase [Microlunatus soli]|uniref:histidine kinase n=2 Tax=Microlunatus soli TaxID=630515 RepID=A0A1H1VRN0_9ACTN|nr:Signal transduction histidine kinase [Microlunatus soli]
MLLDVVIALAVGSFDAWVSLAARLTASGSIRPGPVLPPPLVIILFCSAGAVLLFRRRWPIRTFLIIWVLYLTPIAFPVLQPFMVLLVAMFTVSSTLGRRPAVWSLLATFVVFGIEIVNTAPVGVRANTWSWVIPTLVFDVVMVVLVWVAARLRYRFAHRIAGLERRREEEIRTAVRQERLAVSRDLHDIVSHSVSAMTLQAAGARAVMQQQPQRVRPALDAIEQTGIQAMSELQRLLQVLRSDADYVESTGAATRERLSRLPELIEQARRAGQRVELVVSGDPCDLDPSVEMTCYRVIQEALDNAGRHAGADVVVRVQLEWLPPRLRTSVVNGAGAARPGVRLSTGHGLIGLAERVQLVGGELETGPLPDGGFRITATLPVTRPSMDRTET